MKNSAVYYSVGALLYCPANSTKIVKYLMQEKFGTQYSLALCLEDTINDDFIEDAEIQLVHTITDLFYLKDKGFFIPKIFIRVRNPGQITALTGRMGEASNLITGFIIPKFSLENADMYIDKIIYMNVIYEHPVYMMPILESPEIIPPQNRINVLYALKEKLDTIEEHVLNIRVGGNDLCHMFGFRRHSNESIYQIKPIADIFSDIVTIFGMDYVLSAPVWEYYSGDGWDIGLAAEIQQDKLCGFVGKTVIHPNQIPVVNQCYKVSEKDYKDAKAILNWNSKSESLVAGSVDKERMNEYKVHSNWAKKILILAEVYGIE